MRKILIALAATLAAFVIACGSSTPSNDGKPVQTAGAPGATAAAATKAAAKTYATPKPEDFTVKINETKRQCFGSAGCNVSFSVELTRTNTAAEYDPAKSWKLVYRVDGAEDPYTNSVTIHNGQYDREDSEYVQVKSSKTALSAVITSVVEA